MPSPEPGPIAFRANAETVVADAATFNQLTGHCPRISAVSYRIAKFIRKTG
jgi:hypothetical protein